MKLRCFLYGHDFQPYSDNYCKCEWCDQLTYPDWVQKYLDARDRVMYAMVGLAIVSIVLLVMYA